ncbi:MAG: hypothetical protein EBR73_17080, partial [Rhodobacteraceae bacterium]|nr:hypothetical protein [Paracoccaceae bacterium]
MMHQLPGLNLIERLALRILTRSKRTGLVVVKPYGYSCVYVALQTALIKAQQIYQAARNRIRPVDGPMMCWDCHYWEMRHQACGLALPESKRSGGRYASRCEMYERA